MIGSFRTTYTKSVMDTYASLLNMYNLLNVISYLIILYQ